MTEEQINPARINRVIVHSDGGCHGNPGPGGWGAVLEFGKVRRELSGGAPATTNNRMELQGAIEALTALKEKCQVDFYTDSQYVKKGCMWMKNWKRNGWKTKTREPVKNEDLWRALDAQIARHQVNWIWVKGHAGHRGNERCDELANREIALIKKTFTPEQLKNELARFLSADNRSSQPALFRRQSSPSGQPPIEPAEHYETHR